MYTHPNTETSIVGIHNAQ